MIAGPHQRRAGSPSVPIRDAAFSRRAGRASAIRRIWAWALALSACLMGAVLLGGGLTVVPVAAQDAPPAPPPGAPPPPPPGGSVPSTSALAPAQPDQLLAPIALYPDDLLARILMASTYPLEVVQADRWLQDPANASLSGSALAQALQMQPWDASVKSL